jgi:tRNA pseudouridine55 synthase
VTRRGATALRGVLAVDKPAGMTSHDVVDRIRRATGEGRVGHAGTLDPEATGLLVVLIGPYTRLEPYLASAQKAYEARISFGTETDTDDAVGVAVRTAAVPPTCLDEREASARLAAVLGASLQTPPSFSAVKVGGRVAHRAARAGAALELEPRVVEVFEAQLLSVDTAARTWDVFFRVSKGTYVRALARDLGRACGSAAHLCALRRTASGALSLADALPLDETEAAIADGRLESLLTDPVRALGLPVAVVPRGATTVGSPLPRPTQTPVADDALVAVVEDDRLAGVYRATGDLLVAAMVLPGVGAA